MQFCNLSVYLGSIVAMLMTLVVQVSTSNIIREIHCLCICSGEGSVTKTMYEDCADAF